MNYIYVYDSNETIKYRFTSIEQEGYDGVIKGANVFFAYDDTGAELEGGTGEFQIFSKLPLRFMQGDIMDVIIDNTHLLGRFFVSTSERNTANTWMVSAVDSIAKIQDVDIFGTFKNDMNVGKYLNYLLQNGGVKADISESISGDIISAGFKNEGSLRDLLQKMSLGLGYLFTSKDSEGISASLKAKEQVLTHSYTADDLFENPVIEQKQNVPIGKIAVSSLYAESPMSDYPEAHVQGYVPIGQGVKLTRNNSFVLNKKPYFNGKQHEVLNEFLGYEYLIDEVYSYYDNLSDGRKITDYAAYSSDFENNIVYSINREKLMEIEDQIPGEAYCIDDSGNEYALISLRGEHAFARSEALGVVTFDSNSQINQLNLPFTNESTLDRIASYFSREKFVNFKVRYTGEKLGEIVDLPEIWEEKHHAIIKKMEFALSASKVFVTITADILSELEEDDIHYIGAEYGDGTEYGDDTEYGGYEIYEEGDV